MYTALSSFVQRLWYSSYTIVDGTFRSLSDRLKLVASFHLLRLTVRRPNVQMIRNTDLPYAYIHIQRGTIDKICAPLISVNIQGPRLSFGTLFFIALELPLLKYGWPSGISSPSHSANQSPNSTSFYLRLIFPFLTISLKKFSRLSRQNFLTCFATSTPFPRFWIPPYAVVTYPPGRGPYATNSVRRLQALIGLLVRDFSCTTWLPPC